MFYLFVQFYYEFYVFIEDSKVLLGNVTYHME